MTPCISGTADASPSPATTMVMEMHIPLSQSGVILEVNHTINLVKRVEKKIFFS
jgi:hypothetical protein